MKTILKMAEEYAAGGVGTQAIRKRAYLAGAKAMRDMAAEAASNRGDQHPTLHGAAACEAVAVMIRSLLPDTEKE